MPREYAPVPLKRWGDEDFRALTPAAQHLYLVLSTSPTLSHAGIADWRPRRIAKLAAGWTADDVEAAANELEQHLWLVVDEDTEEALVRHQVEDDQTLKQPNMATAMATAYAGIASAGIRGVLVHDLCRIHEADPTAKGWGSTAARELLERTSVDPQEYPCRNPFGKGYWKGSDNPSSNPSVDPSGEGSTNGSDGVSVGTEPTPSVDPSGKGCPTPAPEPTPTPEPTSSRRSPRGSRLPEDWQPSRTLVDQMRTECPGIDLQAEHLKFRDYWLGKAGKDGTKADWQATWRNWMRNARDRGGAVIPLQVANGTSPWDRR